MFREEYLELAKKMLIAKGQASGYKTTDKLEVVAKAKLRIFGRNELFRCPCAPKDGERSCVSDKCRETIAREGKCGCSLYEPVS